MSTCIPFWNLTPNYSELSISYFYLLSRLGEAAFIIIIIRYKNNYTSTETYSTYNQRKTSPLPSQEFRFLKENRLLVFVQLWILCQTPTYFRISNRKKRLLKENSLKVWNIHENKARTKSHKAGPALHRQWVPPHTAQRISHLMVLATQHGWKLPVGSSTFEFWKEFGISHILILTKSRGKNHWPRAFTVLITTVHICPRKSEIRCFCKLSLYIYGFRLILHL